MAVSPLNLTSALQAWHSAGLSFLLLDGEVDALMSSLRSAEISARVSGEERGARLERPGNSAVATSQSDVTEESPAGKTTAQNKRFLVPARELSDSLAGTDSPTTGPTFAGAAERQQSASPFGTRNFEVQTLPDPWNRLAQKVTPGPVVWIYPELGLDLLGLAGAEGAAASASRGQALRSIIGGLKLKKGTSTFWPVSVPDGNGCLLPDRELFQGGLDFLGAKYLIVFGAQSLAGTDYGNIYLGPFSEQVSDGRMIISLPDFSTLVQDRAKLDSVTVFLHSVFSRVFLG